MTTHKRKTEDRIQKMIDTAKPDQLKRLLDEIDRYQTIIVPTHHGSDLLQ